jgi:hypothetical protein
MRSSWIGSKEKKKKKKRGVLVKLWNKGEGLSFHLDCVNLYLDVLLHTPRDHLSHILMLVTLSSPLPLNSQPSRVFAGC